MLRGNVFLSISTQHPNEKYGSDISLSAAYHDFSTTVAMLAAIGSQNHGKSTLPANWHVMTCHIRWPTTIGAGWKSIQHFNNDYLRGDYVIAITILQFALCPTDSAIIYTRLWLLIPVANFTNMG